MSPYIWKVCGISAVLTELCKQTIQVVSQVVIASNEPKNMFSVTKCVLCDEIGWSANPGVIGCFSLP